MSAISVEYGEYVSQFQNHPYTQGICLTLMEYKVHRKIAASEYSKYLKCMSSKSFNPSSENKSLGLSKTDYSIHLAIVKSQLLHLIDTDPLDHSSDIGRRIFEHLQDDLKSALKFSTISRGLRTRSRNSWFAKNPKKVVLQYVKHKTGFVRYMKKEGYKEALLKAAEATGVGLTVGTAIGGVYCAKRIPPDAPRKSYINEDGEIAYYIDHPYAHASSALILSSTFTGVATVSLIAAHEIYKQLNLMSVKEFFHDTDDDILLSSPSFTDVFSDALFPAYRAWKLKKMHKKLNYIPSGWDGDRALSQHRCRLTDKFMLFPVKDKCGHAIDYRYARAFQLQRDNDEPYRCPISTDRFGWSEFKFDMAQFVEIQRILWDRSHPQAAADSAEPVPESDDLDSQFMESTQSDPEKPLSDALNLIADVMCNESVINNEFIESAKLVDLLRHKDQEGIHSALQQIDSSLLQTYFEFFSDFWKIYSQYEKDLQLIKEIHLEKVEELKKPILEEVEKSEKKRCETYNEQMQYAASKTDPLARAQDEELAQFELKQAAETHDIRLNELISLIGGLDQERDSALSDLKNGLDQFLANLHAFSWKPILDHAKYERDI